MANLFSLSRKPFVVCYCFREPIKTFFLDACQMIVKSRVLHLFPVPETGRSHIINILLASFFGPYCKFRAWAINRWKKTRIRNLQYGPKTRLIRDIYCTHYFCPSILESPIPKDFPLCLFNTDKRQANLF